MHTQLSSDTAIHLSPERHFRGLVHILSRRPPKSDWQKVLPMLFYCIHDLVTKLKLPIGDSTYVVPSRGGSVGTRGTVATNSSSPCLRTREIKLHTSRPPVLAARLTVTAPSTRAGPHVINWVHEQLL